MRFNGRFVEASFPNHADDSAPSCERLGDPVTASSLTRAADGGVAGAVVFAARPGAAEAAVPAGATQVISIRHCRFEPVITIVPSGGSVRVVNEDEALYSLVSEPGASPALDAGLPFPGMSVELRPSSPALGYSIRDRHRGWMRAWLAVLDRSSAVLTDDEGRFELQGLAGGPLVVTAWHPRLGSMNVTIDFVGTTATDAEIGGVEEGGLDLVFPPDAAEKLETAERDAATPR